MNEQTQTTDERCAMLAEQAFATANLYATDGDNLPYGSGWYENGVAWFADRIIAMRTEDERALRSLDARDNRNLRAYGLPEIR